MPFPWDTLSVPSNHTEINRWLKQLGQSDWAYSSPRCDLKDEEIHSWYE